MKRARTVPFAVAVLFAASTARAQQEPQEKREETHPPDSGTPERTWYGWQLIGPDLAAISVIAAGMSIRNDSFHVCDTCDADRYLNPHSILEASGVLIYLGGSALVHIAHGQSRKAAYSLALRAGGPVVGAGAGFLTGAIIGSFVPDTCTNSTLFCLPPAAVGAVVGTGIGGAIGLVAAPIIDYSVLAYEDRPAAATQPAGAARRWQVVPVAALPRDAAGRLSPAFGLAGVF
jgi:hypothetical protein